MFLIHIKLSNFSATMIDILTANQDMSSDVLARTYFFTFQDYWIALNCFITINEVQSPVKVIYFLIIILWNFEKNQIFEIKNHFSYSSSYKSPLSDQIWTHSISYELYFMAHIDFRKTWPVCWTDLKEGIYENSRDLLNTLKLSRPMKAGYPRKSSQLDYPFDL